MKNKSQRRESARIDERGKTWGLTKKNRGCLFNIIMAFLVIAAITALSNGYRQKGNAEKASTKTIATAKPTAYVTAAPTKIKKPLRRPSPIMLPCRP